MLCVAEDMRSKTSKSCNKHRRSREQGPLEVVRRNHVLDLPEQILGVNTPELGIDVKP